MLGADLYLVSLPLECMVHLHRLLSGFSALVCCLVVPPRSGHSAFLLDLITGLDVGRKVGQAGPRAGLALHRVADGLLLGPWVGSMIRHFRY